MYEERIYRELHNSKDLLNYEVVIEESDLMVSSDIIKKDDIFKILNRYRKVVRDTCKKYKEI